MPYLTLPPGEKERRISLGSKRHYLRRHGRVGTIQEKLVVSLCNHEGFKDWPGGTGPGSLQPPTGLTWKYNRISSLFHGAIVGRLSAALAHAACGVREEVRRKAETPVQRLTETVKPHEKRTRYLINKADCGADFPMTCSGSSERICRQLCNIRPGCCKRGRWRQAFNCKSRS